MEMYGFKRSISLTMDMIAKAKKLDGKLPGIATHFTGLDNIMGWLHNSDLMILAGRRPWAKRLKQTQELGLIVIDYLQLIEGDSRYSAQENRVREVSKMTRELKLMAKELHVPVVVLSQLSYDIELRGDKRPRLADLRKSDSIEQDADIVMAVYREWYYLPKEIVQKPGESNEKYNARVADLDKRKSDLENIAEVLVLKNRRGKTGNIKLSFVGKYSDFNNLAQEDSPFAME